MPSSFAFVTFSDVNDMRNAFTKTQIKRHAMKEIGVTRRRPRKSRRRYIEVPLELLPVPEEPLLSPRFTAICSGAIDPFLAFPVELDDLKRELVANIFQNGQTALRQDWFSVSLMEESTFYSVLANSAVQFSLAREPVVICRKSTVGMYFYEKAISAVRVELSKERPHVTEGLIGTVAGLVCWADIVGDQQEWNIQVKGVLQLLQAYEGGLKALGANKYLRSTLSWVELRGAYMHDVPCRIPLPEAWLDAAKLSYCGECDEKDGDICYETDLALECELPRAPVFDVCRRLRQRSILINSELDNELDDVPTWVNIGIHNLLCIRPLQKATKKSDIVDASIQEACRLGFLLLLGAIWCMRGAAPTYTDTILQKLHHLSVLPYVRAPWQGHLWRIQVWLFCVAALESTTVADGEKLRRHFVEVLCIITESGSDLVEIGKNVLGFPKLFDGQINALCEDVARLHNVD